MNLSIVVLVIVLLSFDNIYCSSINNNKINSINTNKRNTTDNSKIDQSQSSLSSLYSYDSNKDRYYRYNKLIASITTNKNINSLLVSLEERLAILIKEDVILLIQSLLSLWTILNVLLEHVLANTYKHSIRIQSLIVILLCKAIDIIIRMNTIQSWEHDDDGTIKIKPGIKSDSNSTTMINSAKNDIRNIVNTKESQQIAYAMVILVCMVPVGSVYPLILADIPNIVRLTIIITYVMIPNEMKATITNRLIFKENNNDSSILDTGCELLAVISEILVLISFVFRSNMSWLSIVQASIIVQYSIARLSLFSSGSIDATKILSAIFPSKKTKKRKKKKVIPP